MLRNEVQRKTGLTRKAMEYYEEKGLIKPHKSENGYRDYSEKDLEVLTKVSLLRKIGISLSEIEEAFSSDGASLSSILRRKQHRLEREEKRKEVLEAMIKGEEQELLDRKIAWIEAEESIYERLERAFPGYFGQMIFWAYQPFLKEPLEKEGEEAYAKYVAYLDALPVFTLTKEEQEYLDQVSASFDVETLRQVNQKKIDAIYNAEQWLEENKDTIARYESYKNSEEYQHSPMKGIQEKLQKFMLEHGYYETAIPLIRKFSKSYDAYYTQLLEADKKYADIKNTIR